MDNDPFYYLTEYELLHLAVHLEEAGRQDDLHHLLSIETKERRNAWFEAKESISSPEGFATDIARAWRLSDDDYLSSSINTSMAKGGLSNAIGLSSKYALCLSSLNTIDKKIRCPFMILLVEYNIWNLEKAVAYVKQSHDAWEQFFALEWLAPRLSPSLLEEALSIARSIDFPHARTRSLAALAAFMSPVKREEIAREALECALLRSASWGADTLMNLAPLLSGPLLTQALAEAKRISDSHTRIQVLVDLIPNLPVPDKQETSRDAVVDARAIERADLRAETLARLSTCVPPAEREAMLQEALHAANDEDDPYHACRAYVAMLPYLPDALIGEAGIGALNALQRLKISGNFASWGDRILREIAPALPRLSPDERLAAYHLAREISDDQRRAHTLSELAPLFPQPFCEDAFAEAFSIVGRGNYPYQIIVWKNKALFQPDETPDRKMLLAFLEENQHSGELERWVREASILLQRLPVEVSKSILLRALNSLRVIDDEKERAELLIAFLPRLPKPLLEDVLIEARAVNLIDLRFASMMALAQRFSPKQRLEIQAEALGIISAIDDEGDRARALVEVLPYVLKPLQQKAFELILTISFQSQRAELLALGALYLKKVRQEAITILSSIEDVSERARWLIDLVPYLPMRLRSRVVKTAMAALASEPYKGKQCQELISSVSYYLSRSQVIHTFKIAAELSSREDRDHAIWMLAVRRSEIGSLSQALKWVYQIENTTWRRGALTEITKILTLQDRLKEALWLAQHADADDLPEVVKGIVSGLPDTLNDVILLRLLQIMRTVEDVRIRIEALTAIALLLQEPLQTETLQEALEAATSSGDDWVVFDVLVNYLRSSSALPPDKALSTVQNMGNEHARAHALASIAAYLNESQLQSAVENIQAIKDLKARTTGLVSIAGLLPETMRLLAVDQVLREIPLITDAHDIIDLLKVIAPQLQEKQLESVISAAVAAATSTSTDEIQAKTLSHLAIVLKELNRPRQGLAVAQGINNTEARIGALTILTPQLAELPPSDLFLLWQKSLPAMSTRSRKDLLQDLASMTEVIYKLGGEVAVGETLLATQSVRHWWP